MKTYSKPCPDCGQILVVEVTQEQFTRLAEGRDHIQNILPELSASSRERFISGYCGPCWDRMFEGSDG